VEGGLSRQRAKLLFEFLPSVPIGFIFHVKLNLNI
jgi:hypothetical protein